MLQHEGNLKNIMLRERSQTWGHIHTALFYLHEMFKTGIFTETEKRLLVVWVTKVWRWNSFFDENFLQLMESSCTNLNTQKNTDLDCWNEWIIWHANYVNNNKQRKKVWKVYPPFHPEIILLWIYSIDRDTHIGEITHFKQGYFLQYCL
jgi:hypothetical protein